MISLSTRRLAGLVAALSAAVAVAVPAYAQMAANQPPDAVDDSYSATEDEPLTVAAPGVLGNDTDPDAGSTLTAKEVVTPPKNGSVTLNSDGSFTFTPKKNSNGEETFDYRACDNGTPQACDVATVTLTVAKVQDPFVPTNDTYMLDEDTVFDVSKPGVLGNDDPDSGDAIVIDGDGGDPLSGPDPVSGPKNGFLILREDGSFGYLPNEDFNGVDLFVYRVCTTNATPQVCADQTVTLTVNPATEPPVARDDSYRTTRNRNLFVPRPGILANDSDAEGQSFEPEMLDPTQHGKLELRPNGSFVYRPNRNYTGNDQFTYVVKDSEDKESNFAAVRIRVAAPPPPPPPPITPGSQCTIRGTSDSEILRGTPGPDVICAGGGNDILFGGAGNDRVFGGSGNDVLFGEEGEDRLAGGSGNDVLSGKEGKDRLAGGRGNDSLTGGEDPDRLFGGPGSDACASDSEDTRAGC